MSKIQWKWFETFLKKKSKVQEILNFENFFLSLKIQLNYQKMILKGKISQVTSSHLSQQHRLH